MAGHPAPYRFRLPDGFSDLHPDFGRIVRERRVAGRYKQEAFAADIGISRLALSNIERGKASPRPETLDRILDLLEIDHSVVAVKGRSYRVSRPYAEEYRAMQCLDLGKWLRSARKREGLTLSRLAAWSGVSASQLSRIERGECIQSAVFVVTEEDRAIHVDDKRIIYANPVLRAICEGNFDRNVPDKRTDAPMPSVTEN